MSDNNKHNLNDLTKHHLNAMEVHTLVSNLRRIELEKEIRDNPPDFIYLLDMLLGIAFLPIIGYLLWISIASADTFFQILLILLVLGAALRLDFWYIRTCWFMFCGK